MTGSVPPPRLVVLGSSVTALAVARNAARLRMRPVVVDTDAGIATSTRIAEVVHLDAADPSDQVARVCALGGDGAAWLVATGDAWLRFVVAHRAALDAAYARILHPSNPALETCLSKQRFATWCAEHAIPAPRGFAVPDTDAARAAIEYPVLVRPIASGAAARAVPKAVEAHDATELAHWLRVHRDAGSEVSITESLLGRPLAQFSVGASRRGRDTLAFVAQKRRPLARQCAVGTYVELAPDPHVDALARAVLDALDYQGIAEVEILRDTAAGRDYVIEVNPRPWIQYALGPASGHDLLAFQLDPASHDPRRARRSGTRWLCLGTDLYYAFSRSTGAVRSGELSLVQYVWSLARANAFAHLSLTDPAPAWRSVRELWRDYAGRRSASA